MRSTKSRTGPRTYRMTRRADSVEETRRQITAAAARLHTTVGPSQTTVAGIAEEAGVTRLTVYRHFDDLEVLFAACRAHWRAENPPPDAAAWASIGDLEDRARAAFTAMYGWFADHADELFPIYRDMPSMPPTAQEAIHREIRALADLLCGDEVPRGEPGRRMRAVARHLLDYRTWRSLAVDGGLSPTSTVESAVRMLLAVTLTDQAL